MFLCHISSSYHPAVYVSFFSFLLFYGLEISWRLWIYISRTLLAIFCFINLTSCHNATSLIRQNYGHLCLSRKTQLVFSLICIVQLKTWSCKLFIFNLSDMTWSKRLTTCWNFFYHCFIFSILAFIPPASPHPHNTLRKLHACICLS